MQIIIRYKKKVVDNVVYEYYFYPFRMYEMTPPHWAAIHHVRRFWIRWGTVIMTKTQIDN